MITCDRCKETIANTYCRCACQREPKPQHEIIKALEAEIERLIESVIEKERVIKEINAAVIDAYQQGIY